MGLYEPDITRKTGKTKVEEGKYEILNVPLGDIFGVFNEEHNYTIKQKGWINIRSKVYNWAKLRDSLIENNYDPQKFSYIEVNSVKDINADNKGNKLNLPYICGEGNHRLKLLKETHPPTHKIDVLNLSWDEYKVKEGPQCVKNATPTKKELKDPRKLLEYTKSITIASYFFLLHFQHTLLMLGIIGLSFLLLPSFKKEEKDHKPHNKLKWMYDNYTILYRVMMTIYHNLRLGVCVITGLIFSGYLIYYDTINFLILSGIVICLQSIQAKFFPEPEDND